jgi:putative transcriptional regulator
VVVIVNHDDAGALGLVLNRPGEAYAAEVAPVLTQLVEDEDEIYVGGPVRPDAVLLLAEFHTPTEDLLPIVPSVGLVTDAADLDGLAEHAGRSRAYAGYAGWGPGQLDAEIEREDWFVTPAEISDLFCERPWELWSQVLERMGDPYRLIARMPEDPSLN